MAIVVLDGLFGGGSILVMQRHLGAGRPVRVGAARSATWVAAIGWLPLLLLAAIQSRTGAPSSLDTFLTDAAMHCRALVAAPALTLGRAISYPQLSRMCVHFTEAGLISALDRPRFTELLASTRRLEASPRAAVGAVALAYLFVLSVAATHPTVALWQAEEAGWLAPYSPAGWWHILVSLPILLVLLLGWFWRLLLWARLLWIVAGLHLQLVPAHPDKAGGLKFIGYAVRSFAPAGFALGVIVAGGLANRLARGDVSLTTYRDAAAGLLLFVLVVFGAPPIAFVRPLSSAWQRGIHQYGSFAHGLGQSFERKWLRGAKPDASTLEHPDFSTLTDLHQIVGNVYAMRVLPVDIPSLVLVGVVTTLPIAVVAIASLPMEVLGQFIIDLMF